MKRIFSLVSLLGVLAVVSACSTIDVEFEFAAYNATNDPIDVIVEGRDRVVVDSQKTATFSVDVEMSNSEGISSQPADRWANVSVAVRNRRTGQMSGMETCQARTIGVNNIEYKNGRVNCSL